MKVRFFQHFDRYRNTIYEEQEESLNDRGINISTDTLDSIIVGMETEIGTPYFIKIDTQGSELDILKDANLALKRTAAVLIETSIHEFFKGGPLINDILMFMTESEFRLLDIADLTCRLTDRKLAQMDLLFVREDSALLSEKRNSNR